MPEHPTDEVGASAVEYGILVSAIAAMIVVVVGLFGLDVLDLFNAVCQGPFSC